jgi:hypothetical protein
MSASPLPSGSFSALASNNEKQASQRGRSHSLKLDQAKHRPSRRSPRPILRVGNWGVGSKAVPTFHEEGEVQVLSPGTCTSACPCPALPYLGPKAVYLGQGSLLSSPCCALLSLHAHTQSHACASISDFLLLTFARQGANRCDSALSESWLLMRS